MKDNDNSLEDPGRSGPYQFRKLPDGRWQRRRRRSSGKRAGQYKEWYTLHIITVKGDKGQPARKRWAWRPSSTPPSL